MKTPTRFVIDSPLACLAAVLWITLTAIFPCEAARSPEGSVKDGWFLLTSPDGSIEVRITARGPLTYSVTVDGEPVIKPSRLGLALANDVEFGQGVDVIDAQRKTENSVWENKFGKRRYVNDRHNELRLRLRETWGEPREFVVVFRVFNDGIGFRYLLPAQPGVREFTVDQELTEFRFAGDNICFAGQHENGSVTGSQEWEFKRQHLSNLKPGSAVGLPLLVQTKPAWVAVTESDLMDWAGLWLANTDTNAADGVTMSAKLAPRREGDGLVRGEFPRQSPWRVLMIAREPGRLIESDLVLNLAAPCQITDTSWIKPGMMAWDHWWSGDVQMDTATLKRYIQLASDMGWPYQLVDWQWYGEYNKPTADITKVNPAVDMNEVRRFAKEKGVRLWLWLYWTDVERNDAYKAAFQLYEDWGIAGVKIDFMDSDDQYMVKWYDKLTRAAADHHLMINFHGAYKPTGLNRTLPNQVTREGILGNEYNRWSARVTPEHKLTLPFTRFLAGPADFTPGGFVNRQPSVFKADGKRTQVQGTRASELALFVAYDSPVACVCDFPDHYTNGLGADFLKVVPTVWDDTRVLIGMVGEQLVIARRSGDDWYLGALTDRNAREITVKLDFLGEGRWKTRIWQDALTAKDNAESLEIRELTSSSGDSLSIPLAPAGGAVARFRRQL